MQELSINEYEKLRGKKVKLLGRVIPHDSHSEVLYYSIPEGQQNFSATEILDTLLLTHPYLKGTYDVFRHWTDPEVVTIKYRVL